ncbi:MAG: alpha/beta hydrolase [Acidimicrobiia bacterium]|nr:alpha/beta hydrolase [Acidimicrobiia bacterium]
MTRIQSSFVTPAGLSLTVHEWGGTGAPVLLAHPTGFHGVVWKPVAERLVAAGRRVWSFDFRGQGDSDPSPDATYSWDEFADDADAVLDHLELRGHPELLAAGHSKGAAALFVVAMRDPAALPRVWTFEPIVFPNEELAPADPDNPMSVAARKRRDVWPSRDEAIASYGSRPPMNSLDPESLRAYVDYGFRDRPDGQVELKCRPEHEANIYMMGAANGLFTRLGQVEPPVLVACGGDSRSITPAFAEQLVERLPHARLEVWAGHGHFGPLDDPNRAVASMLAFDA